MGLSATIARKDGHHPIIFMQCGPVRHRVNAKAQAATRPFEHLVLVQPTAFQPSKGPESDKREEFQALYQELVDDEPRNRRICEDVVESVNNGRSPLVLNALADLRKVWGVDAPERVSIDAVSRFASMSDEALELELARHLRIQSLSPVVDVPPALPQMNGGKHEEKE